MIVTFGSGLELEDTSYTKSMGLGEIMLTEYIELLRRNDNYRNLWLGYVISQLGDWFNLIASAALVATLTSTGTALSYLFLARFLPMFLFSPFAGVLSDRFDRRWVMIVSDVLRAVTVLCFLLVRTADQLWLFYFLTVMQFVLSSLFVPARSAMMSNIVEKDELIAANALDSLTWSTMLAFGALLGGLATGLFGVTTAFILDVLTFLLSAWFVAKIRTDKMAHKQDLGGERKERGFAEIVGGVRYLWHAPLIFVVALVKGGGSFIWGAVNVLEIEVAENVFPLIFEFGGRTVGTDGAITLAVIFTMSGLGTGFGPLIGRRILGDSYHRLMQGITIAFFLLSFGLVGLAYSPNLAVFSILSFVRTVGAGTLWVFSAALLQMIVPDEVRGRVFAFEFAILTLTQSVSILMAGIAQDQWGWSVWDQFLFVGWMGVGISVIWMVFQIWVGKRPLVVEN